MKIKRFISGHVPCRFGCVCMYVCCGFAVLTSCSQEDMSRNLYPGGDASPSGTPVAFSIRLQDTPGYNAPEGNAPSTRSGEKLIAEWVKVNSFSVTRSGQERDEDFPRLAAMELFEDTVSALRRHGG